MLARWLRGFLPLAVMGSGAAFAAEPNFAVTVLDCPEGSLVAAVHIGARDAAPEIVSAERVDTGCILRLHHGLWRLHREDPSGRALILDVPVFRDREVATDRPPLRWMRFAPTAEVFDRTDPREISAQLVDAVTGKPIAGLAWCPSDEQPASISVGAPGVVTPGTFSVLRGSPCPRFAFAADGYVTRVVDLEASSEPRVTLVPELVVTGIVVGITGAPIPNAAIYIEAANFGRVVRSDGEGVFWVDQLDATKSYRLKAVDDGAESNAAVAEIRREPVPSARPLRVDGLRLVIDRSRIAVGKVVDIDEKPVAGATVALCPSQRGEFRFLRCPGAAKAPPADADGLFVFRDLPAGSYHLLASAPGFAPMIAGGIEIPAAAPRFEIGTVVLGPPAVVSGRVRSADGLPIAGATVEPRTVSEIEDGSHWSVEPAVTNQQGDFELSGFGEDEVITLVIRAEGFAPRRLDGVVATSRDIQIELAAAHTVTGTVVDALTGMGVGGARVEAGPPGDRSLRDRPVWTSESETTPDGSFEITNVPPGVSRLTMRAPGYQERWLPIDVRDTRDLGRLPLRRPDGVVEGVVVDERQTPVSGARIEVSGAGRATSATDGRFRVGGVALGGGWVVASDGQGRRAREAIHVKPGLVATVTLTLAEPSQIRVQVSSAEGTPLESGYATVTGEGDRPVRGRADRDGNIALAVAGLGPYRVFVAAPGHETVVIEARAGQDLGRVFLDPRARLEGKVVSSGGGAGQLSRVRVVAVGSDGQESSGWVAWDGSFALDVKPGRWKVRAWRPGTKLVAEEEAIVGPNGAAIELALEEGRRVTGRVSVDGAALAGVWIEARGGSFAAHSRTGGDGTFELQGLPPTTLEVSARSPDGEHLGGLPLDAAATNLDLAFQTTRVEIGVNDQAGAGVAGAEVTLTSSSRSGFFARITDAQGRAIFERVPRGRYELSVASNQGTSRREAVIDGPAVRLAAQIGSDVPR